MGSQRTGKGFAGDVVLDAGALIAFERGDDRVRAILKGVHALGGRVFVPATVLGQTWRPGPRLAPVARLVAGTEVRPLDEQGAKEIGVRLGIRGGADVVDAQVVCCALQTRAAVVTSDPGDVGALIDPSERLIVFAV